MPVQDPAQTQTMNEIAAHQYTFRADPSIPSPAGDGVTKREEGAMGDDKSPAKGKAVNRVGRACNGCRKQKMRCEGADNPPCKRCKHANIPCMFEKPMREQQGDAQSIDRIQKLESTVGNIQDTLSELVTALKGANALPNFAPPPPAQQGSPASASQNTHYASVPPRLSSADAPAPSPPNAPAASVSSTSQASAGSLTSPVQYMTEREMQAAHGLKAFSTGQQQQRSASVGSSGDYLPASGSAIDGQPSPSQRKLPYPIERNQGSSHSLSSQAPGQGQGQGQGRDRALSMHTEASSGSGYQLPPMSPISANGNGKKERLPPLNLHLESITNGSAAAPNGLPSSSIPSASAPASAAPRDPRDRRPPLPAVQPLSEIISPKRPRPHTGPVNFSADIDSMGPPSYLNRPRSAHGGGSGYSIIPSSNVTSAYSSDDEGELPTSGLTAPLEVIRSLAEHNEEERERRRAAEGRSRATSSVSGDWPEQEGGRPSKRRKVEKRAPKPHAHPDVVTKGIITEEEALELFSIYYEHCSKFLPVFEPENDTYEELHRRSPFSVDAICMVASGVKDGSSGPSETTKRLIEEVKAISSNTLWLPVARREVVQAVIVVAGWSTNGWLLGGHAIRMALELGIHKAWPKLLKKIRSGKPLKEALGSDEHDLIVCSRIWFALFLFEHQISFGTGRPFMIKTDESVEDLAAIMQHPLSREDDMRLVSSVELMIIREGLHVRLGVEGPVTNETWEIIKDAEMQFGDWLARWDMQLAWKWPEKPFYRHSLLVQRCLSELFHNAIGLRGIKDDEDVEKLGPDHWQRKLAIQCMNTAQSALDICCRSFHYRDSLKYAPDYTHVTATFAAAFLIRLARLFPTEVNLSAVLDDVSSLAKELANASATRYANTLRRMIRIAQKRRILPEQVTVNGDRGAPRDGAGGAGAGVIPVAASDVNADGTAPMAVEAAAVEAASAVATNGPWPNGEPVVQPGQPESLSPPEDLSLITGLPMLYPDPEWTEPALGGDHPLAGMYLPAVNQQDQIGWFPPETSFAAFHPQAFGYQAVTGNWNLDENGNEIPEIW